MKYEKMIQVRFRPEDSERAKAIAERKGLSLSAWIRSQVLELIEQEEEDSGISKEEDRKQ